MDNSTIPEWLLQFKDGDIIADIDDDKTPWVGIFKSINDDSTFNTYCYRTRGLRPKFEPPHIYLLSGELSTDNRGTYRQMQIANETQRKLLFDIMKEWGYQWDAEKKELSYTEEKLKWKPKHMIFHHTPDDFPCRFCSAGWQMAWSFKESTRQWMCRCRDSIYRDSIPSYNRDCQRVQEWIINNKDKYELRTAEDWYSEPCFYYAEPKYIKKEDDWI